MEPRRAKRHGHRAAQNMPDCLVTLALLFYEKARQRSQTKNIRASPARFFAFRLPTTFSWLVRLTVGKAKGRSFLSERAILDIWQRGTAHNAAFPFSERRIGSPLSGLCPKQPQGLLPILRKLVL